MFIDLTKEIEKYNLLHKLDYYGRVTPRLKWFDKLDNPWVKSTINILKSSEVILDVGCGKGSFIDLFKQKYGIVINGIDISEEAQRSRQDLPISVAFAHYTGFRDKLFDCVYHFDGMEHIPIELEEETIEEQFRLSNKYIIHSICWAPDKYHDKITHEAELGLAHVNIKSPEQWQSKFEEWCKKFGGQIILTDVTFAEHINFIIEVTN